MGCSKKDSLHGHNIIWFSYQSNRDCWRHMLLCGISDTLLYFYLSTCRTCLIVYHLPLIVMCTSSGLSRVVNIPPIYSPYGMPLEPQRRNIASTLVDYRDKTIFTVRGDLKLSDKDCRNSQNDVHVLFQLLLIPTYEGREGIRIYT
jgi:hypothetical protein